MYSWNVRYPFWLQPFCLKPFLAWAAAHNVLKPFCLKPFLGFGALSWRICQTTLCYRARA